MFKKLKGTVDILKRLLHRYMHLSSVVTKNISQAEADNRYESYDLLYRELLMTVQSKFPDETRHETALRYIRERELNKTTGGKLNADYNYRYRF